MNSEEFPGDIHAGISNGISGEIFKRILEVVREETTGETSKWKIVRISEEILFLILHEIIEEMHLEMLNVNVKILLEDFWRNPLKILWSNLWWICERTLIFWRNCGRSFWRSVDLIFYEGICIFVPKET